MMSSGQVRSSQKTDFRTLKSQAGKTSVDDPPASEVEDNGELPNGGPSFGDVQTRKTVNIGLVTKYLRHWTCREAFREVYQNW